MNVEVSYSKEWLLVWGLLEEIRNGDFELRTKTEEVVSIIMFDKIWWNDKNDKNEIVIRVWFDWWDVEESPNPS